ncbi:MAG TPA: hypothetical protein VMW80_13110 [Candidatus Dormibacteraeota bacterium]|nr:hypothetical protein [Candidatus Dormibacteraeota bacterium]
MLRLQPQALAVKSRTFLPELGFSPTMALAGGWLWVEVGDGSTASLP